MSAVVKNPHHLDMEGHRIANLDDPTSDTEAATKGYVDRAVAAAIAQIHGAFKEALVDNGIIVDNSGGKGAQPKPKGV